MIYFLLKNFITGLKRYTPLSKMTNQNDSVFFSVIVPCIEGASVSSQAIQSVINQEFKNFEIILVTSGNSQHCKTDFTFANTKTVSAPYGELNIALNYGVKSAAGSYVCFLMPHDEWYAHHLLVFYSALKEKPLATVLFTEGKIDSVIKNLNIDVDNKLLLLNKNQLTDWSSFSLSQFCINKVFFIKSGLPALKFYSYTEKFIVSALHSLTQFLKINNITCHCPLPTITDDDIESIDRKILTTVFIARNISVSKQTIKQLYFRSYFYAVFKLLLIGQVKLSFKYLVLYIKTIQRLYLNTM